MIVGVAHGVPIVVCAQATNSREAVVVSAFIMTLVAFLFGSDAFIVNDLIGVALGTAIGFSCTKK